MKIRNKLILAIAVPVGLLVLQIALVNLFVRELQEAVTFISATHETIEDAFTAGDLVSKLRGETKRLPSSFVSDRAEGDKGLELFREIFRELEPRIQSIIASGSTREAARESLSGLDMAFKRVSSELVLTDEAIAAQTVDMNTLLERAIFLDATLVNLSSALTGLTRELRIQLQLAVDRERDIHNRPVIAGIAIGGLSVLMLLFFTWLVVDRFFVARLTGLSKALLSIAGGDLRTTLPEPKGRDEVDDMARTVETFRVTALERNTLLEERAETAERLEKEVAVRTTELEAANQYTTRFLAAASHDLRQPLHALNLFIGQLRDKPEAAERHRLEGRISEAAASMNELFDALLDMSKLEAGILVPEVTSFPISSVFDRLEATFATAATNKGLRLRIVSCGAWVRSDTILLERILMNLVSNALKATIEGGVVVGCRRRGDTLRIDVCDTGPGIPEALQQKLFKEFYRLNPPSPGRSESLGLGLSIVDGLGQILDHQVALSSTPGQGTRFSVSVPVVAAEPVSDTHPAPPVSYEMMIGRRVLVIEDDALVRESMAGILGAWRCNVVLAEGVREAQEAVLSGGAPDLVISDYRLAGGQTGLDAIAEVHRIAGREVPAFLMTAETSAERLREASRSGYPILHKPVTPMALRALSSQLLAGS